MQRRQFTTSSLTAAALLATTQRAWSQSATVGQAAPGFSAKDVSGKTVSLADFKGKTVVLEWVNPGCPYVRKHYRALSKMRWPKMWFGLPSIPPPPITRII
jgi:thiol-disulfide isomerase/thioredoxin